VATLTYCTNVHPGANLAEVERSLDAFTVPVARAFAGEGATFPVGLYVSAASAAELADDARRDRFAAFLAARRLAVATFNCFPFGGFHADEVKLAVYRPTWLDEARVTFTLAAARAAARLAPEGAVVPISTVAGSCKLFGEGEAVERAIATNLARVAAALARLHDESGREIVLCLEPEPFTTLETIDETLRFFAGPMRGSEARAAFVATGGARDRAELLLARHVGVCLDACHQAVEFEPMEAALVRLVDAGVRIGKLQLSSALATSPTRERAAQVAALRDFAEPRWLHQAFLRRPDGEIVRNLDLPEGIGQYAAAPDGSELRIHYHVPIDRSEIGPLATTQGQLHEAIAAAVTRGATGCFEVETYTFPALPRDAEPRELVAALTAELRHAAARLGSGNPRNG